jgi:hypothetical protein
MPFTFDDRFTPEPGTFDPRFNQSTGTVIVVLSPTVQIGRIGRIIVYNSELRTLNTFIDTQVTTINNYTSKAVNVTSY